MLRSDLLVVSIHFCLNCYHVRCIPLERQPYCAKATECPLAALRPERLSGAEGGRRYLEFQPVRFLNRQHQVKAVAEIVVTASEGSVKSRMAQRTCRLDLAIGVVHKVR